MGIPQEDSVQTGRKSGIQDSGKQNQSFYLCSRMRGRPPLYPPNLRTYDIVMLCQGSCLLFFFFPYTFLYPILPQVNLLEAELLGERGCHFPRFLTDNAHYSIRIEGFLTPTPKSLRETFLYMLDNSKYILSFQSLTISFLKK